MTFRRKPESMGVSQQQETLTRALPAQLAANWFSPIGAAGLLQGQARLQNSTDNRGATDPVLWG